MKYGVEANELIEPLLQQIEKECVDLAEFIKTKDFPYHKLYYFNRVVKHAAAMLLLAGEIKAIHQFDEHATPDEERPFSQEDLIQRLTDCKID
jgi:hypothetical protein